MLIQITNARRCYRLFRFICCQHFLMSLIVTYFSQSTASIPGQTHTHAHKIVSKCALFYVERVSASILSQYGTWTLALSFYLHCIETRSCKMKKKKPNRVGNEYIKSWNFRSLHPLLEHFLAFAACSRWISVLLYNYWHKFLSLHFISCILFFQCEHKLYIKGRAFWSWCCL